MAIPDKALDLCLPVCLVGLLWISDRACADKTYVTFGSCHEWTDTAILTSYCTNLHKTKCCYRTCCDSNEYYNKFVFKTCKVPTQDKQLGLCTNYYSTKCCASTLRKNGVIHTQSQWSTCCQVDSPKPGVRFTYKTCYSKDSSGRTSRDYCTNTMSTYCCYGSCCDWRYYFTSYKFSTCGRSACRDIRWTKCCSHFSGYPPTCCHSENTATAPAKEGGGKKSKSLWGGISAGTGILVLLIVISAVLFARHSSGKPLRPFCRGNSRRNERWPATSTGPSNSGAHLDSHTNHVYINPAMQTEPSPEPTPNLSTMHQPQTQTSNPNAMPPPAYDDVVRPSERNERSTGQNMEGAPPKYDSLNISRF